MTTPGSWILEIRNRLSAIPADPSATPAHVALVPLYVDGGELWALLVDGADPTTLDWGTIGFVGAQLESGEDPWRRVEGFVENSLGVSPSNVLRLGELPIATTARGLDILPCVAAIPRPQGQLPTLQPGVEIFALPLSALQSPRLVEERMVQGLETEAWVRVYHMGRRQLAGATTEILEGLMYALMHGAETK